MSVIGAIFFHSPKLFIYTLSWCIAIVLQKLAALSVSYVLTTSLHDTISDAPKGVLFFTLLYAGFKILEWLFFLICDRLFVRTRTLVSHAHALKVFDYFLQGPPIIFKKHSAIEWVHKADISTTLRTFIGFCINHFFTLLVDALVALVLLYIIIGPKAAPFIFIITISLLALCASWVYIFKHDANTQSTLAQSITLKSAQLEQNVSDLIGQHALAQVYGAQDLFIQRSQSLMQALESQTSTYKDAQVRYSSLIFTICALSAGSLFIVALLALKQNTISAIDFSALIFVTSATYWKLQNSSYIFLELNTLWAALQEVFALEAPPQTRPLQVHAIPMASPHGSTNRCYDISCATTAPVPLADSRPIDTITRDTHLCPSETTLLSVHKMHLVLGTKTLLDNVAFDLPKGTLMFVVGASGAGKTSFLHALLGHNHASVSMQYQGSTVETLEPYCAYVPQHSFLTSASVAFNLLLANPNATADTMYQALHKVALDEYIRQQGGLDCTVFDLKLSGGQLQRLSIARALLSERPIMLLDEPTASLDGRNETLFIDHLQSIASSQKISSIIVTHRLLSIPKHALVLVLNQGRMLQFGTCQTLLHNTNGAFYLMYQSAQWDQHTLGRNQAGVCHE